MCPHPPSKCPQSSKYDENFDNPWDEEANEFQIIEEDSTDFV
jgi:hypothetical protein